MTEPTRYLAAWRMVGLAGSRDIIDGLVLPEHRGPSPDLARALADWPGAWYWADDARTQIVLIRGTATPRPERWLWHGALLILFVLCTLGAGCVVGGYLRPPIYTGLGGVVTGAVDFGAFIVNGGIRNLADGWEFAFPLLGILLVHELGHYFTARRYAIDVSPPYFIPVPPNLSPIGGLGAFIRLRSPVYDRRQLLDVGAMGPLAGFVVAVAVLVWGYHLSTRSSLLPGSDASFVLYAGRPIVLGASLLTRSLRDWLVPGTGAVLLSPQAFAGWVGMFITGLNLLPLSQLDGGHVLYGMIGKSQRTVALLCGIALLVLGVRAPMWYAWAALTFVIGGGRWSHPSVIVPDRAVLRAGWWTGVACVVVFVLTFVPVPFRG